MNAIWVTWEPHRRTREIAATLGMPLFEFTANGGLTRYRQLIVETTRCLLRERPTHVFIQCPSIVLAVWTVVLKPFLRYALIADLHNEAVEPYINRSGWYRHVLRRIHRAADLNLVTNDGLIPAVTANGGHSAVLPDRVPQMARRGIREAPALDTVVFVCSFAPDEPYAEVIESAAHLTTRARILVTGNPRDRQLPQLPPNVQLTGFLPVEEYERLLETAAVVVDLTRMENCLVCGAYEAVAYAKPLVTSDTATLRATFGRAAVFTPHDPRSLAAAIGSALDRRSELAQEMARLRPQLDEDWRRRRDELLRRLETIR